MEPRIPGHHPPLIIAEIGTSHGGDLTKAKELIQAAREAGAQVAKFQYVIADEILHPKTGKVSLPSGNTSLYQVFKTLEQPREFYQELISLCTEAGLGFLCSPFGSESLANLLDLGVDALKIASPELNHLPLLRSAAASGLPTILSTGVSRLSDIEEALQCFVQDDSNASVSSNSLSQGEHPALSHRVSLLHCITSYPAPEEEYNLRVLKSLHSAFGVPVGISDHSLDPVLVPLLATALGAHLIEKHFTLSKKDAGLDDPIALDPLQFKQMTGLIASYKADPFAIIPDLEEEYGTDHIQKILGTGIKALAPSEVQNYGRSNRSIHALHHLSAGTVLSPGNIAVLRTEKELQPGLHPRFLELVYGKVLTKDVPDGQGLTWEHLLS
jgi:N-acetylneuraminate synthase